MTFSSTRPFNHASFFIIILFNFINVYGSSILNENVIATKQNIWIVVIFTILLILFILYKSYRLVNKSMTSSSIHFFVVANPPDKLTILARRSQVKVSVSEHIKVHETLSLSNESTEAPSSASSNPCAHGHHHSNPDIISDIDISSQESCSRKSRKTKWPMLIEKKVPSFERRLTEQMKMKMMQCPNEDIEPKLTFYSARTKLS